MTAQGRQEGLKESWTNDISKLQKNSNRTVKLKKGNCGSQKYTWWMVVKVTEFSLLCLLERKFSLSRSDMKSIKALSTLTQPFSSATVLLAPSAAMNLVDKNSETSSSKYWRTCGEKGSDCNPCESTKIQVRAKVIWNFKMKTPYLQIWCHCLHSTIFLHQHQQLPVAQEGISKQLRHEWLVKVM